MKCEQCGQISDWIGESAGWHRAGGGEAAAIELYECAECGHVQHGR